MLKPQGDTIRLRKYYVYFCQQNQYMTARAEAFERLATIMDELRLKCPWDNKQTMESAQSIYGVTMPEPGVSKLMSVKFE